MCACAHAQNQNTAFLLPRSIISRTGWHIRIPATREAETGGPQVPCCPGLHREAPASNKQQDVPLTEPRGEVQDFIPDHRVLRSLQTEVRGKHFLSAFPYPVSELSALPIYLSSLPTHRTRVYSLLGSPSLMILFVCLVLSALHKPESSEKGKQPSRKMPS